MIVNQYKNLWDVSNNSLWKVLETDNNGLTTNESTKRLVTFGHNQPPHLSTPSPLKVFFNQFKNALIILLILISIFSFFIGEHVNATIILLMLLANAIVGFLQELKAEKSLEKLKKYIIFKTKVLRDRKLIHIDSSETVPGDIVYLNAGDIIPADIRLTEAHNFSTNESILTGESVPVSKTSGNKNRNSEIPQYIKNGVFMGTSVITGSAKGIVVYTGKKTFLGKTVSDIGDNGNITNFQKNLIHFTNILFKLVVVFSLFIFISNAILGRDIIDSFLFGITLALGITPEVLPIIITIAISKSAYKLSKKQVIIRRLSALEDLGNIDILCTDKTGTITEGELHIKDFYTIDDDENRMILEYAILCNASNPQVKNKFLENPIDQMIWEKKKTKELKEEINTYKILDIRDFDFETKDMGILVKRKDGQNMIIVKGATESVISLSKHVVSKQKETTFTKYRRIKLEKKIEEYEKNGHRTISVAYKLTKDKDITEKNFTGFTYAGYILFSDPPRVSLKHTFDRLTNLNVTLKIITGDSPTITHEICSKAGLEIVEDKIILGSKLEKSSKADFHKIVEKYNVFARVTPEHKLKIISALKDNEHVVGYLGDGINDVGALQTADVGISVNSGVDVAKDSSDIILLKKNLSTLIDGIIEGRKTFGNTIKFIINTMSSSYGNVVTIAISSFFLKFLPLLPTQVLLIDSVSDAQHLTISTDNVDSEFLKKPRKWNMKFFLKFMLFFGMISTIFDLVLIAILIKLNDSPELFRSIWFIESVLTEIVATFVIRTQKVFFKSSPSTPVILTSLFAALVTIVAPYVVIGQELFGFVSVSFPYLLLITVVIIMYILMLEFGKRFFYKRVEM